MKIGRPAFGTCGSSFQLFPPSSVVSNNPQLSAELLRAGNTTQPCIGSIKSNHPDPSSSSGFWLATLSREIDQLFPASLVPARLNEIRLLSVTSEERSAHPRDVSRKKASVISSGRGEMSPQ